MANIFDFTPVSTLTKGHINENVATKLVKRFTYKPCLYSSIILMGFIWITNSVRSGFNATQMFWLRVWLGIKLWKRYVKSVIILPTFTHSFETPFCLSDWCIDRLHNGEKLSENPSNH